MIGTTQVSGHTSAGALLNQRIVRQILLGCGILSVLVYAAADVVGGMRYPGYSFSSQAVSELMAVGAPSEAFVDPLFILYGVFVLAFGVGVWVFDDGADRSGAARTAGALLSAQAVLGFTGPTWFEMSQRGAGSLADDTPHIVLTGVLVLLQLFTIGFGAFALGKRFRIYSFATLLLIIALGALSAPYGARLAAGEPTPGFGIIERILIYVSLLWIAVFATALLRRSFQRRAASRNSVVTAGGRGK